MAFAENLDFLNANTLRNFPIKEGMTKVDSTGSFVIPDDWLVDASISASSDVTLRVYISKVVNMPDVIELELSRVGGSAIGSFTINPIAHNKYDSYYLAPTGSYSGATGKIVVCSVEQFLSLPYGTFTFSSADTELETRVVVPSLAYVSSYRFVNADGSSFSVTGDVTIVARTNVKFRQINTTTVAIDVGDGLGLNAPCANAARCISTINGVAPDDDGNFSLTTSDCAKFTPIADSPILKGLNLADSCCKPCLSCNEIGELTERLMQLETDLLAIRQHYSNLSVLTTQFGNLINASCECT